MAPEDVAGLQTAVVRLRRRAAALQAVQVAVGKLAQSGGSASGSVPAEADVRGVEEANSSLSGAHMQQPSAQAVCRLIRHVTRVVRERQQGKWTAVNDASSHYRNARAESADSVSASDLQAIDSIVAAAKSHADTELKKKDEAARKAASERAQQNKEAEAAAAKEKADRQRRARAQEQMKAIKSSADGSAPPSPKGGASKSSELYGAPKEQKSGSSAGSGATKGGHVRTPPKPGSPANDGAFATQPNTAGSRDAPAALAPAPAKRAPPTVPRPAGRPPAGAAARSVAAGQSLRDPPRPKSLGSQASSDGAPESASTASSSGGNRDLGSMVDHGDARSAPIGAGDAYSSGLTEEEESRQREMREIFARYVARRDVLASRVNEARDRLVEVRQAVAAAKEKARQSGAAAGELRGLEAAVCRAAQRLAAMREAQGGDEAALSQRLSEQAARLKVLRADAEAAEAALRAAEAEASVAQAEASAGEAGRTDGPVSGRSIESLRQELGRAKQD